MNHPSSFRTRQSILRTRLSRRDWLRMASLGLAGTSLSGWLPALAEDAAANPQRRRACILLWMTGGPSQIDTFDPKPEHANGGEFQPIDTSVPGVRITDRLPKLAQVMEHVVPIRSMSTREGDHTRGTYLMRTGYLPQGPVQYPTLGSLLSKELGAEPHDLPNFVSIAPSPFLSPAAYGPGFLGPRYAPLVVGSESRAVPNPRAQDAAAALQVANLALPRGIDLSRADARLALLNEFETEFAAERPGLAARSHQSAYQAAVRMMRSEAVKAFTLDDEPDALRDAYGRNPFGQGCLLARRLVERGVPFVEVSLNRVSGNQGLGWDTHQQNFAALRQLCGVLDPGWATLISDLKDRGLLDSTLIVWMGEFGRTPRINNNAGRDHFPAAWTTVLCGGGVRGGQVVGETSPDGMRVKERPVSVADLIATICLALGLDPRKQNLSNVGRPIRLADPSARPIRDIVT